VWDKGESTVTGLIMNYSEPDEERHELHLMTAENVSTRQATDWLLTFHKVKYMFLL